MNIELSMEAAYEDQQQLKERLRESFLLFEDVTLDQAKTVLSFRDDLKVGSGHLSELGGIVEAMEDMGYMSGAAKGEIFGYIKEKNHFTHSMMMYDSSPRLAAASLRRISYRIYSLMPLAAYLSAIPEDMNHGDIVDLCDGLYDFAKETKEGAIGFFGEEQREFIDSLLESFDCFYSAFRKMYEELSQRPNYPHFILEAAHKIFIATMQLGYLCNKEWFDLVQGRYFNECTLYGDRPNAKELRDRLQDVMTRAASFAQQELKKPNNPVVMAYQPSGEMALRPEIELLYSIK